ISRSLGVKFGGVIAIFFYAAQAVAVTLYVAGFTESILSAFPALPFSYRTIATATNLLVFFCVYIGAGWTIRIQYGILAILALSILSFFIGAGLDFSPDILRSNIQPQWTHEYSFFTLFALLFPAVTGIMAGVNMSGDLKDPSRSIPNGTLTAIGVTIVIYAAVTFVLAAGVPRTELQGTGFVMKDHALFPVLIYAGVICATLSSALGSMMGAPRILQAFARDNIFRRLAWFGRGSGRNAEPRNAIILTFLIAQGGILAGGVDTVAPIITMFFLMTYGTVNLACFYEGRSRNPSFRPSFRLNHWTIALTGALGCLIVMFLTNVLWASIALALSALLYYLISRADIRVAWGDVDSGVLYQRARSALLRLERSSYHPKNWRPSILALSGGPYNRLHLADYACWFTADSGIVTIAQIIHGKLEELFDRRREAEDILRKFLLRENISAFPAVIVEENTHAAIKALVQCHGISGIRPNTLLLGWSEDPEKEGMYRDMLITVKQMRRSLLVVACEQKEDKTQIPEGAINLWWNSAEHGALMLLLAYLLRRNPAWSNRPLRIIQPVPPNADTENIERQMREMLVQARIDSELIIIPTDTPFEAVRTAMQPSAVLFAGFDPEEDAVADLRSIAELPGDVILVYNAGDASLSA
ncbi:MAG: amino acid permease, partial [Kiritimatiellae bacterium]|nr:amino acid permease [Kiritimatiellia bacterium]